jgi:hypothetical protein
MALTEEQKAQKIMQFLAQKREGFAITILQGLCCKVDLANEVDEKLLVDKATRMADQLLEKLYPMPKKEEDKAE